MLKSMAMSGLALEMVKCISLTLERYTSSAVTAEAYGDAYQEYLSVGAKNTKKNIKN